MIIPAVILALALAAGLLLAVPFDLALRVETGPRSAYSLSLGWLWGRLQRRLDSGRTPAAAGQRSVSVGRPAPASILKQLPALLDYLLDRALWREISRLAKRSLRRVQIHRLEADFEVGLADPADTFYLFFGMECLNRLAALFPPCRVNLRACFNGAVCAGRAEAVVRIVPVRLVIPALRFLFSAPLRGLIKKWVVNQWKKYRPRWKVRSQPAL